MREEGREGGREGGRGGGGRCAVWVWVGVQNECDVTSRSIYSAACPSNIIFTHLFKWGLILQLVLPKNHLDLNLGQVLVDAFQALDR